MTMPSDKAKNSHAYKRSADNLRSSQTRPSSSGSQAPTQQTPRRRPSTLLRNNTTPSKLNAQATPRTTSSREGFRATTPSKAPPSPAARDTDRDSFHSILEDPFFQEYDPSSAENRPAEPPRDQHTASPLAHGNEWEGNQRSTRPRRESLTIGSSQASQIWVCPHK